MSFDNIIYQKFANQHIASAERIRLQFMPDTIPYNHTAEQYANAWIKINDVSKGKYFYTDGYSVSRVGWFTYAWQNLIGFFGFTNHCQPARASITLAKFAYYGYIKGYHTAARLVTTTLDVHYLASVNSERNRLNTSLIQQGLVNTYLIQQNQLQAGFWLRLFSSEFDAYRTEHATIHFGINLTWTNDGELLKHAIRLDPGHKDSLQAIIHNIKLNPELETSIIRGGCLFVTYLNQRLEDYINKKISIETLTATCKNLDVKLNPANVALQISLVNRLMEDEAKNSEKIVWPEGALAREFANRLLDKYLSDTSSLLMRSLNSVKKLLGLKADEQPAVQKAAALDPTIKERRKDFFIQFYLKTKQFDHALFLILSLTHAKDQLKFITSESIDPQLIRRYVTTTDSDLAKALTAHYMALNNDTAAELFTSADHRHATYTQFYFKKYIASKQFSDAFKLYEASENKAIFDVNSLSQLAEHFHSKTKSLKANSKAAARKNTDRGWEKAEHLMTASNQAAERAFMLCNTNGDFKQSIQSSGYHLGRLLVNSPIHSDQRIARLDIAIKHLSDAVQKCSDAKVDKMKDILLKALFERAEIAVNACRTTLDRNSGHSSTKEHKAAVLPQVEKALDCYRQIIALDPDNTIHGRTAEAHFMLADIETYFDINKNTQDYLRAMALAPLNPFYKLRCAEFHEADREELRAAGMSIMEENKLSVQDYMDWSSERWYKRDDRVYGIVDIHRYNREPAEESSTLGTVLSYLNPFSYHWN